MTPSSPQHRGLGSSAMGCVDKLISLKWDIAGAYPRLR
jgi:hypothetical protein